MRKLFSLFLALVATTTLWASDFKSGDLYYTITSSSAPYTVEVSDAVWSITSAIIPETVTYNGTTYSVTSIGEDAFRESDSLTSVTIPNSVTSIGSYAFAYCTSLTSVTIPNSVTSIGYWAFFNCSSLTSPLYNAHCFAYMPTSYSGAYTISEGIEQIADGAFSGCSSLTSVTIPNSVTSIGESAFYNCSSLTSVTIPNSVTSIGNNAFGDCSSLTSVFVEEGNTIYDSRDNCNAIIETATNTLIAGCQNTVIPNSVTSIGNDAFFSCSSLTSVTCEAENPPTVGKYAFDGVSKSIPVYVPCGCVKAYKAKSGWNVFTNIQEPLAEYSIEVNVNDTIMGTAKVNYNTFCEGNQISATQNLGYHFVQWSDGVTDNPRTLELTQDTILIAEFAQSFSGQCGDNLYWVYANDTLTITGTGAMYDERPWGLLVDKILKIALPAGITHIGNDAFKDCMGLRDIDLPYTLETIGDYSFNGCRRLITINCYPLLPPIAESTSFSNYSANLYAPCNNLEEYKYDMVFGQFKYFECIGSESVSTNGTVVTPGSTDVTITWPTDENADTYTILIMKGEEIFCRLLFNTAGQLLNIAFAPGRSGSHPVTYAASTGNGLRFTVTSLDAATTYGYDITTKDEKDNTLSTYTGEFTTKSNVSTSVSDIQSPMTDCQKLIRDGQLFILRDGKTYNVMGVEM